MRLLIASIWAVTRVRARGAGRCGGGRRRGARRWSSARRSTRRPRGRPAGALGAYGLRHLIAGPAVLLDAVDLAEHALLDPGELRPVPRARGALDFVRRDAASAVGGLVDPAAAAALVRRLRRRVDQLDSAAYDDRARARSRPRRTRGSTARARDAAARPAATRRAALGGPRRWNARSAIARRSRPPSSRPEGSCRARRRPRSGPPSSPGSRRGPRRTPRAAVTRAAGRRDASARSPPAGSARSTASAAPGNQICRRTRRRAVADHSPVARLRERGPEFRRKVRRSRRRTPRAAADGCRPGRAPRCGRVAADPAGRRSRIRGVHGPGPSSTHRLAERPRSRTQVPHERGGSSDGVDPALAAGQDRAPSGRRPPASTTPRYCPKWGDAPATAPE